ncbi:MAG: CbbQ/NirQ/NorQ C-terminal domain-containing protein, partial [Quisquiliibacterium sp.]
GYQSVLKDLKPSTRQRFVSIEFDYPAPEQEAMIIAHESGADPDLAQSLARIGLMVRNLKEHGFEEGVSTRLLVYAGQLAVAVIAPRRACDVAIAGSVSDDRNLQQAITEIIDIVLP